MSVPPLACPFSAISPAFAHQGRRYQARPQKRACGRVGVRGCGRSPDISYHRALMVTHQGCPQTPGGRIRALGFARMGARGRRRGPIPARCQYQGSPVSYGCPQTPGGRIRALGFARMGARGRRRGPIPTARIIV